MSDSNGQRPAGDLAAADLAPIPAAPAVARKPRMDPNLLTPNDYRRLRVALDGKDPDELLGTGLSEDAVQTMILAFKLRADRSFTWEQAGDVPPASVFDMSGGDVEPPPPTAPPGSPGPEGAPKKASASRRKPRAAAPATSSAPSTD